MSIELFAIKETNLYNYVINWIKNNTDFKAYNCDDFKSKNGGNVMDWCFKEFRIPSFMYEVYTSEYGTDPYSATKVHLNLVYWMKKSLPFFMYLLVNIENLHDWKIPDIEPNLPEDVLP